MSQALDSILAHKRSEVAEAKAATTEAALLSRAADREPPRGFLQGLDAVAATGANALICELKRKSPSAGVIAAGADPARVAREYEQGGAAALSVLTDNAFFGGSLDDLREVRRTVQLPILRKDFMIDPWQVAESRAHGADAVLVIIGALPDGLARELLEAALGFGMDVLLEAHTGEELDRAIAMWRPGAIIGINNRDLTKMETDLAATEQLAPRIPAPTGPFVSESGISTPADINRLRASGARRFLIGESLMHNAGKAKAVAALRSAGV